ncbi:MAG: CRISPR-associated protein Cas4 [Nitrososphaerota archaeon]
MSEDDEYVKVVDLKHYGYCPRIIYITNVLHFDEVSSEAMEMGRERHEKNILAPLIAKLKPVKVFRELRLISDRLKLSGVVDYLIVTRFGEYVIAEVKWSKSDGGGVKFDHKLQLAAYALLVYENFGKEVKRAFIYYRDDGRIIEVFLSAELKKLVEKFVRHIHRISADEEEPRVRMVDSKCNSCGFRNYCRPGLSTGGIFKESLARGGPEVRKRRNPHRKDGLSH